MGIRLPELSIGNYAAFIPDPRDYFRQNVSSERLEREDWWDLFDGVLDIYSRS